MDLICCFGTGSIVLFGTVGLIYIMFTAGLEIDMKKSLNKAGEKALFLAYTRL